jgi:hypothetical protein
MANKGDKYLAKVCMKVIRKKQENEDDIRRNKLVYSGKTITTTKQSKMKKEQSVIV